MARTRRGQEKNGFEKRSDAADSAAGSQHEARDNRHVRGKGGGGLARGEEALDEILSSQQTPLLVILDCVQDPHNLGAILRTADGAGVHAVIAPKDKSVGLTETVQRVAVGAAETVPFIRVTNLSRTMKRLKKEGVWLIGTSDAATQNLYQSDLTAPCAIVMGAEGDGMRRLTEENCDLLITLPMAGEVPCLNVSVATAVCLYEAVRQRMA